MKKLITIIITCVLFFTACSSNTNTVDLTDEPSTVSTENINKSTNDEKIEEKFFDNDVDIILAMYAASEDTTIEDYVAELKESDPDGVYSIYNEDYYIQTIKESERKAMLDEIMSADYLNSAFQEIFSDEEYNGAFVKMEYDDLFQNVSFYVDREAYDNAGLLAVFGPFLLTGIYSDSIQAYNLIPVESRTVTMLIIDNDTNEVIYDSSQE